MTSQQEKSVYMTQQDRSFFFIFVASFLSIYAASHANVELLASHREQSPILRATAFGASPEFIRRLVYMLLFFAVFFYQIPFRHSFQRNKMEQRGEEYEKVEERRGMYRIQQRHHKHDQGNNFSYFFREYQITEKYLIFILPYVIPLWIVSSSRKNGTL